MKVTQPVLLFFNEGKTVPIAESDQTFLNEWLGKLPTVPSHYCRNTPSYQNKKFLEPDVTISGLHTEYKKAAAAAGKRVINVKTFNETFHNLNYSVFRPRKDQCDTCVGAKYGNRSEADYLAHIKNKDAARAEKTKDKENASTKKSVWTFDTQAVLICPKANASALYYKTKLQVHNLSFYNLQSHDGYCYVWDETEGNLSAEMFTHIQYQHFDDFLATHSEIKELTVWSDGCCYQNRNVTLGNAYLDLARKRGVKIIQKFLVVGHTQMEVDSMHAVIERKIPANVYTPCDYMVIMECARSRPSPYVVKSVHHNDVLQLDGSYVGSIRPGKKTGDPTVNQLRAIEYNPDATIRAKLSFSDDSEWIDLPQRIHIPDVPLTWIPVFQSRIPISSRKYNDLQSMKCVLPQWAHDFYNMLPHI